MPSPPLLQTIVEDKCAQEEEDIGDAEGDENKGPWSVDETLYFQRKRIADQGKRVIEGG